MKVTIYMGTSVLLRVGNDIKRGVPPDLRAKLSPCTIFLDTDEGEIYIDTAHTPPESWKEGK